uniref:UPAR/Ly6 domain-containing protein n=1 Tax=Oryzias latipes TaxID=8090 RepID=A0A3P9H3H9_ORYLA
VGSGSLRLFGLTPYNQCMALSPHPFFFTKKKPAPAATPNGRQCFTCDGSTCDKTLACEGTEDHCVIETVDLGGNTTTIKGCISKLMCSVSNIVPFLFPRIKFSCCKGNLCNSAVTASAGL